jgi:DNA-binding transcriptional LysR family regulator
MIDRYQLRYFLAVVDSGNFSRAAAQCHVTQPTLSSGIANLERIIGAKLFLRNSRRVELTPPGTRLLAHARRIESEFNLAQQAIIGATNQPLTRIGILRSIPATMIARISTEMLRLDPDLLIEFVEGSERELLAHLARGRIEAALTLVGRGDDRYLEEALREEGYAMALPHHHPRAAQPVIQADEMNDNVMIVRRHCEALTETSRHFTERGVRPHFALRTTNDERVLHLVAAGLAVTVMPDCYAADGVARVKLAGFDLTRTIGLIFASGAELLSTTPTALIQAIRNVVKPAA